MIDGRFKDILSQIPGINKMIEKINRTSLRNQIIIQVVFYTCLYFLIVAAFG